MPTRRPIVRPHLLVASLLLLSGCTGDSDPVGPDLTGGPPNGSMTATVDGGAWSAASIQIVRTGGLISIGASNTAGLGIGLAIQEAGTGTYTVGTTPTTGTITAGSDVWTASGTIGSGSIVVTSLDATSISGTFAFSLDATLGSMTPPTRAITNGAFTIQF